MGLDQWITARAWVKKEERIMFFNTRLEGLDIKEVVIDIIEWRKCNWFHGWFMSHAGHVFNEGERIHVEKEHLENLITTINKVLKNKKLAKELLPCQEGFFFGGQDYDEYYFGSLKGAKEILTTFLNKPIANDCDFEYHASW